MREPMTIRCGWVLVGLLLAGSSLGALTGTKEESAVSTNGMLVAGNDAQPRFSNSVVREIDDQATGLRWVVLRDQAHPGGPGRLFVAPGPVARHRMALGTKSLLASGAAPAQNSTQISALRPVIRQGEHLIIEEHSAVVDARLEAVALSSAKAGELLKVRLIPGGNILKVKALAAGSAMLPDTEVRP